MTKPTDNSAPLPDADIAKTYRHLRFLKALIDIDDPELERALAVILDRLAKAKAPVDGPHPVAQAQGESNSSQD